MTTHFVVFACNQIGTDVLNILSRRSDCVIDHLFTYELPLDVTYGYEPVTAAAERLKIPCSRNKALDSINDELEHHSPDYIFSVYYRKILPESIFGRAKKGAFNIHPSKLPAYRGPTPTGWALVKGEKDIGISIHAIDKGIDTGAILATAETPIRADDTGFTLQERAMRVGAQLFSSILPALISGDFRLTPQVGAGSYYGPISSLGKRIHWHEEVDLVHRKIRCFTKPYGGMYTELFNKTLMVYSASVQKERKPLQGPGRLVAINPDEGLVVSCADGYLEIQDYEFIPAMTEIERTVYLKPGNRFDT